MEGKREEKEEKNRGRRKGEAVRSCQWEKGSTYVHTPSDKEEDSDSHCNTCEKSYTEQHQDDRECNGLGPQGHDLTGGDQSCRPLQHTEEAGQRVWVRSSG